MKTRIVVIGLMLTLGFSLMFGQTNLNIEQGIHAFGSYDATSVGSVDLANGNVNIDLPLFSYPERGGFKLSVELVVTGKQWKVQQSCNADVTIPCSANWTGNNRPNQTLPAVGPSIIINDGLPHLGARFITQKDDTGKKQLIDIYYSAVNADGAVHLIGPNMGSEGDPPSGYSLDGSGIVLTDFQTHSDLGGSYQYATGIITRKGVAMTGFESKDANGNIGEDPTQTLDTMGRSGIYEAIYNAATISDTSGCSGSLAIQKVLLLSFPGPNDSPTSSSGKIKLCLASIILNTKFSIKIDDQNTPTYDTVGEVVAKPTNVVQSIILYNGVSWTTSPTWTFEFNNNISGQNSDGSYPENYGDLTRVILPTGGSISYSWATMAPECATGTLTPVSRWVTQRIVSPNSGDPNVVSAYTYDDGVFPSYIPTTTVTDAQGNYTQHFFGSSGDGCSKFEYKTVWHSLGSGNDKIVKTTTTDYGMAQEGVTFVGDGAEGALNLLPTRKTTTLPNGLVSKTETDYDSSLSLGYPAISFSRGTVSQVREYDYGVGAPGALIRCTQYTYKSFEDSRYLAANLLDLPTSRSVYSGACGVGTLVSRTTHGYDESSLQPSGVTTGFDASVANPGVRGNQTSTSRWLNTSNGTINTASTYYDTGMPYSSTDGDGNTTLYAYSQDYAGAYLTQTTMPPTGSVAHKVSGTYDFNTGVLASYTDENSNPSTYSYDGLARATAAVYPDGGGLALSYPNLQTVDETRLLDVGRSTTGQSIFDGMGRIVQYISPSGSKTDTRYDNDGRVASVTNAYSSTSDPTYGITLFVYDALGRKTEQRQPDGSKLWWCYDGIASSGQPNCLPNASSKMGTWVDFTDESGRHWQKVSDALGRLVAVMEPDASSTPKLETDYTYDALDNLTSVKQVGSSANGETPRMRNFDYDSLSRLIASSNPETSTALHPPSLTCPGASGTWATCYTYDANDNLKTKVDNRGVTTTYNYDALNRLTSKTYSGGSAATTASSCYQYDTDGSSSTNSNLVGRLVNEWTIPSTATCTAILPANGYLTLRSILEYDAMGRVEREQQCHLSHCTSGVPYENTSDYNLAGNPTSFTSNVNSVGFVYSYDAAGRLLTLGSALVDSTHPGSLLSIGSYTPAGAIQSMTLGPNINVTRTYDNRLRVTGETAQHP